MSPVRTVQRRRVMLAILLLLLAGGGVLCCRLAIDRTLARGAWQLELARVKHNTSAWRREAWRVHVLLPLASPRARQDALLAAVEYNDITLAKYYLDHNVSADAHDGYNSALCYAARNKNYQMAELLLQHGANINLDGGNAEHEWPLHDAVQRNYDSRVVDLLLRHGADPTFEPRSKRRGGRIIDYGDLPEFFSDAIRRHDAALIKLLLSHAITPDGTPRRYRHLDKALIAAVAAGDVRITGLVLDAGADVNGGKTSVLAIALARDDLAMARYLLSRGVNLRGRPAVAESLLNTANESNHPRMVALLFQQPGFTVSPANLQNNLCLAASNGSIPTIEILLAHGAKVNGDHADSDNELFPVVYALRGKHVAAIKYLFAHGAKVRPDDVDDWRYDLEQTTVFPAADRKPLLRLLRVNVVP
jgi:ankyrin repeat protein